MKIALNYNLSTITTIQIIIADENWFATRYLNNDEAINKPPQITRLYHDDFHSWRRCLNRKYMHWTHHVVSIAIVTAPYELH